jgi:VWFA-related protein
MPTELRLLSFLVIASISIAAAAPQNDTIRVSTRLVQINVVVRDKNGPIHGLKASDFTLLDEKKPQKIEVFSVFDGKSAPVAVLLPKAGVISNLADSEGEVPNGATAILFDMLNTTADDQTDAIKQLTEYLKTIRPENRIALYILAQQLYVVQDFTGDSARLTQIASQIRASEQSGIELRTPGQLINIMRPPNFTIGSSSSVWVVVPGAYAMADASAINQAVATTDALQAIARHLKGVPGRKTLVWLSAGFPFAPPTRPRRPGDALGAGGIDTPDNFSAQLGRASRALNDANVALYPVDVRRLAGGFPEVMDRLADATGGSVAYHTNDVTAAVRNAVADGETSYVLGFYSTADAADKTFHQLTVKVNRKNAEVHHRSGYYPDDTRVLTDRERQTLLGELLASPLNASQIALTAVAEPDPSIAGNYRVAISVSARDLQFDLHNNRRTAKLILATRLESSKDKNVKTATIPISIPEDQFQVALARGIPLTSTVPGNGGDRLRIVIQDQATGFAGALWLPMPVKQSNQR